MIDTVRVAELNNELGVVQDSIERAQRRAGEIVAELRAMLIDQPGQVSALGPMGSPVPVSKPGGGAEGMGQKAPARTTGGRLPVPQQPLHCQYCEREFPNRRGLPMHESRCESNPGRIPNWTPTPVGTGEPPRQLRPTRETFLCDRCQDPFPSRQALAEHRRGHPEVPPAPGPMRSASSLASLGVR